MTLTGAAARNRDAGDERRRGYLDVLAETGQIMVACRRTSVAPSTVEKWRIRYPWFEDEIRAVLQRKQALHELEYTKQGQVSVIEFRQRYFGHDTPWFMADMIHKIESAEPGSFTLILLPPEHGKTTVIEEWMAWRLAYDRTLRFLFATSDGKKSEKRVQRLQRMFSPDGPCARMLTDYGTFKPETGLDAGYQPWTKQFFNIAGKEQSDERDYTCEAQGIDAQIAGARCDYLIFDDIQSLPSLGRTEAMLEKIRQDWLTRPGALGRTVMIGTRVGPYDIYEAMIDEGLVTDLVTYPAVLTNYDAWPAPRTKDAEYLPPPEVEFLWPQRYTPRDYLILRKNAGETGWERNYMQRGADSQSQPFDGDLLPVDKLRGVNMLAEDYARQHPDATQLVLTLDPGFGVNAIGVFGLHPQGMNVLDGRLDRKLQNNAQIAAACREMLEKWGTGGCQFTHLVIEDKAFQRGLLRDDSFRDLAVRYGLQIVPYSTGSEKNDPNIGIPSLAAALDPEAPRIVFPGAEDKATEEFMRHVRSQFSKWRPKVRGNVLTQDYVIVVWFAFLRWRKMRAYLDQLASPGPSPFGPQKPVALQFKTRGLPYDTTPVLTLAGGVR